MYKKIVEMLEQDIPLQDIADELDLPIKQVRAIEADFYEFI
jgi:uncharacterized protein (DUF433 family)